MKTKEELIALKDEVKALNAKLAELTEDELNQVVGGQGISNPVASMSEEEAMRIAQQLGEGTYIGPWQSMPGEQFLEWWRASNGR